MSTDFRSNPGLPRGLRNNNPGNIRNLDAWQGKVGLDDKGFIVFQDVSWGLRALATDLQSKMNRGLNTIMTIISEYAPPAENDTAQYIQDVSGWTGFDPTAMLSPDQQTIHALMRAIANKENGPSFSAMISDADIDQGISMMNSPLTSLAQAAGIAVSTAAGENPTATTLVALGLAGLVVWLFVKK